MFIVSQARDSVIGFVAVPFSNNATLEHDTAGYRRAAAVICPRADSRSRLASHYCAAGSHLRIGRHLPFQLRGPKSQIICHMFGLRTSGAPRYSMCVKARLNSNHIGYAHVNKRDECAVAGKNAVSHVTHQLRHQTGSKILPPSHSSALRNPVGGPARSGVMRQGKFPS